MKASAGIQRGLVRLSGDAGHDLRFAVRLIARSPVSFLAAAASFALGIGANTAVFTVVNALWLKPAPVTAPDTLAIVYRQASPAARLSEGFRPADARALESARSFSVVAAELIANDLTGEFRPRLSTGITADWKITAVSTDYFSALGVEIRGRPFDKTDESDIGNPSVIVSDRLWRSHFSGDERIIGGETRLGDKKVFLVGVVPAGFHGPLIGDSVDVWIPLARLEEFTALPSEMLQLAPVRLFARLRSGVGLPHATIEAGHTLGRSVLLRTLEDTKYPLRAQRYMARDTLLLGILSATAMVVLVLSTLNLTSLLLATADRRRQEFAVRLALGISRSRMLRLLLAECGILSILGLALALLFGRWCLYAIGAFPLPAGFVLRDLDTSLDWRIVAYGCALSAACGGVVALTTAFAYTRTNVAYLLNRSGIAGVSVGMWPRFVGVAAHVSLSVVLLTGCTLLVRSVDRAYGMELGFDANQVLSLVVQPALTQYATPTMELDLNRRQEDAFRLMRDLEDHPDILGVTAGSSPLMGVATEPNVHEIRTDSGIFSMQVGTISVGPGYFRVTGIPLRAGRDFDERDAGTEAATVGIVSAALASTLWPGAGSFSPVGRTITLDGRRTLLVIGVSDDVVRTGVRGELVPTLFVPGTIKPDRVAIGLVVRTVRNASDVVHTVREAVGRVFQNPVQVIVYRPSDEIGRQMTAERFAARVFTIFAAVALLLCVAGLYGLTSIIVRQRMREHAIRLMLGATTTGIACRLMAATLAPIALGCALGLIVAINAPAALTAYLFKVEVSDPVSLSAVVSIELLAGAGAALFGMRQLVRLTPWSVLRDI